MTSCWHNGWIPIFSFFKIQASQNMSRNCTHVVSLFHFLDGHVHCPWHLKVVGQSAMFMPSTLSIVQYLLIYLGPLKHSIPSLLQIFFNFQLRQPLMMKAHCCQLLVQRELEILHCFLPPLSSEGACGGHMHTTQLLSLEGCHCCWASQPLRKYSQKTKIEFHPLSLLSLYLLCGVYQLCSLRSTQV